MPFADLGIVLGLVLLNGFFAMAEMALVAARRGKLRSLAEDNKRGARLALRLAEDPGPFLSVVQIGITLNGILAGAFSGATLAEPFAAFLGTIPELAPYRDPLALAITVAGVTYVSLVLGELAPKRLGLARAEAIARHVAPLMNALARVAAPLVWLLQGSSSLLLRVLRLHKAPLSKVTGEEVKNLIAEGAQSGLFQPVQRGMLEGVLRLSDRTVRTVMTPRIDVVWLDVDDSPEEHRRMLRQSRYSRVPVGRGDFAEALGVVYAKDALNAVLDGRPLAIRTLMRPPLIVPDTTPVLRLLEQFKNAGERIAIVVDEYGSIEGVASITDVMEAVIGAWPDDGNAAVLQPRRRPDGSWLLDGWTPVDDVETLLGLRHMRDDATFHTLAGFVMEKLGRLPAVGDRFFWESSLFEVVAMDSRRVDKVLIKLDALPDDA